MSKHENKTKEELIDVIDELEQSNDDLRDEIKNISVDASDYDTAILQLETIAEKSFYAGYNVIKKPNNQTKAWLNYKVEARL